MDIAVADQQPAECISRIISLTTPRDACISSTVYPIFKSAADSDSVWEKFLPSDYEQIISNLVSDSSLITSLSKKDLYFHLCHNPIIINNGAMSFSLEKESGKRCYMAAARALCIAWGIHQSIGNGHLYQSQSNAFHQQFRDYQFLKL
ncbi:hypothetical protein AB3S75_047127 [Citrus x aurantiifolia]